MTVSNKFRLRVAALFVLLLIVAVWLFYDNFSGGSVSAQTLSEDNLTLIIDPGHGGADGGAVSISGIYESTINLRIAEKLDQIMGLYGVPVMMTRTSDDIDYPDNADTIAEKKRADQKARLEIVNQTPHPVFISIHQNKFTSPGPFGAQVLYAPTDGSRDFAMSLQNLLIQNINPENYRTASEIPDNIFLLNNVSCPAILIECGFLSNAEEEKLLQTDIYQLKIAAVIAAVFLDSYDTLSDLSSGG